MEYGIGKSLLKFGVLGEVLDLFISHQIVTFPSASHYPGTNSGWS